MQPAINTCLKADDVLHKHGDCHALISSSKTVTGFRREQCRSATNIARWTRPLLLCGNVNNSFQGGAWPCCFWRSGGARQGFARMRLAAAMLTKLVGPLHMKARFDSIKLLKLSY